MNIYTISVVFEQLLQLQLFAKASKCSFGQQKIDYLGHVVSAGGVEMDPSKVQTVTDWPTPMSVSQLRGFLGLSGYYRKFVRGYASVASPLTDLLAKDAFH